MPLYRNGDISVIIYVPRNGTALAAPFVSRFQNDGRVGTVRVMEVQNPDFGLSLPAVQYVAHYGVDADNGAVQGTTVATMQRVNDPATVSDGLDFIYGWNDLPFDPSENSEGVDLTVNHDGSTGVPTPPGMDMGALGRLLSLIGLGDGPTDPKQVLAIAAACFSGYKAVTDKENRLIWAAGVGVAYFYIKRQRDIQRNWQTLQNGNR